MPVAIAATAVLLVLAALFAFGGRRAPRASSATTLLPLAAYAPQLQFSDVQLSESTSLSGGKSTFVDGRVINSGPATVRGVELQVLFAPEAGGTPQMESVPLMLIRTRQPYVDVEPVSAAPLGPGRSAEFRLIFEGIRPEWNQQAPTLRVVGVTEK